MSTYQIPGWDGDLKTLLRDKYKGRQRAVIEKKGYLYIFFTHSNLLKVVVF
jgi:hypothetical protein